MVGSFDNNSSNGGGSCGGGLAGEFTAQRPYTPAAWPPPPLPHELDEQAASYWWQTGPFQHLAENAKRRTNRIAELVSITICTGKSHPRSRQLFPNLRKKRFAYVQNRESSQCRVINIGRSLYFHHVRVNARKRPLYRLQVNVCVTKHTRCMLVCNFSCFTCNCIVSATTQCQRFCMSS